MGVGGWGGSAYTDCVLCTGGPPWALVRLAAWLLLRKDSLGALAPVVRLWVNLASRKLPLPGRVDEWSRWPGFGLLRGKTNRKVEVMPWLWLSF